MDVVHNVAVLVGSLRKDSINRDEQGEPVNDGTRKLLLNFMESFSRWITRNATS